MSETTTLSLNTIQHTELGTSNVDGDKAFLGTCFGWTFDAMPGENPYFMINGPDGVIGGIRPLTEAEPGPATTSYIGVADLEATLEAVTHNGGKVIVPIQEVPSMGRFFWFTTPGGVVLACWQDA